MLHAFNFCFVPPHPPAPRYLTVTHCSQSWGSKDTKGKGRAPGELADSPLLEFLASASNTAEPEQALLEPEGSLDLPSLATGIPPGQQSRWFR